jgi:hypothetical protein
VAGPQGGRVCGFLVTTSGGEGCAREARDGPCWGRGARARRRARGHGGPRRGAGAGEGRGAAVGGADKAGTRRCGPGKRHATRTKRLQAQPRGGTKRGERLKAWPRRAHALPVACVWDAGATAPWPWERAIGPSGHRATGRGGRRMHSLGVRKGGRGFWQGREEEASSLALARGNSIGREGGRAGGRAGGSTAGWARRRRARRGRRLHRRAPGRRRAGRRGHINLERGAQPAAQLASGGVQGVDVTARGGLGHTG